MYQDQSNPFTREQLVFVINAAMAAAFDKVEGALPTGSRIVDDEDWKKQKNELINFIWGAVNQVGIFIPILWAQTEGVRVNDGMGTNEFDGWEEFQKMVEDYIAHNTCKGNTVTPYPDCRALAEKIVDNHWSDYLRTHHV